MNATFIFRKIYAESVEGFLFMQRHPCLNENLLLQISQFHNEIIADLLSNITHHQWRVRMSCCLALSDILRSHPLPSNEQVEQMWTNLFRVMDDFHEATRNTAENTTKTLSKVYLSVENLMSYLYTLSYFHAKDSAYYYICHLPQKLCILL